MKKLTLVSILALTILFISCEKIFNCVCTPSVENGICIDTALIDSTGVCLEVYDPVCGCDGYYIRNI